MKLLIVVISFFTLLTFEQELSISRVRSLYKVAAEQEEAAQKMLVLLEPYKAESPNLLGYKAAAHMMMAKHTGNPFKKLSHFNKGKEMFSAAVKADDNSPELRFLRFAVQSEAPAFLGYQDNIEGDKALLLRKVPQLNDKELKEMIVNYLLNSKNLTSEEKESLMQ